MFNSFYVSLNLLDDPGLPLRLLGRATALVDLLGQSLDVPLGVQQVSVVRVVFSGVFEQVLQQQDTAKYIKLSVNTKVLTAQSHRAETLLTLTSSSYRGILWTGLIIRSPSACFSLFSRMQCC